MCCKQCSTLFWQNVADRFWLGYEQIAWVSCWHFCFDNALHVQTTLSFFNIPVCFDIFFVVVSLVWQKVWLCVTLCVCVLWEFFLRIFLEFFCPPGPLSPRRGRSAEVSLCTKVLCSCFSLAWPFSFLLAGPSQWLAQHLSLCWLFQLRYPIDLEAWACPDRIDSPTLADRRVEAGRVGGRDVQCVFKNFLVK